MNHKFEEVWINKNGMRVGISKGNEMRGNDIIYDPWLRIPKDEAKRLAMGMYKTYKTLGFKKLINSINNGGINHINRFFFELFLNKRSETEINQLMDIIIKQGTKQVNILYLQMYAHRLKKINNSNYETILLNSINLCKELHSSFDKWIASGYFWLARYNPDYIQKTKYCIATILEPRDINTFSPHMKFWKLYRATAWLIGNEIKTLEAQQAVQRFKQLNFSGYIENNNLLAIGDTLEHPEKCLKIMSDANGTQPGDVIGNP